MRYWIDISEFVDFARQFSSFANDFLTRFFNGYGTVWTVFLGVMIIGFGTWVIRRVLFNG